MPEIDPLQEYSLQVDAGLRAEGEQKKAAEKDEFAKGLASIKMNADGRVDITGHKDYVTDIVKNAQEAPMLRAQLSKINDVLAQQLDKVNRQEQFVSSHPILSVLASVAGHAAQDGRMPPIVRALGATASEMYPSARETGGEKLGILKEMLAGSAQEERMHAMTERMTMQAERLQQTGDIAEGKAREASLRTEIQNKNAETNRLKEQAYSKGVDSLAKHRDAQDKLAPKVFALKQKLENFKEKMADAGPKELPKLRKELDQYDKDKALIRSQVSANEKIIQDTDPSTPGYQAAVAARSGLQEDLRDIESKWSDAQESYLKVKSNQKGDAPKSYKSAEEVRDDPSLSKDQKLKLLRDQFKMK